MAANCAIGVDLGGTKMLVGVVDESLGVLHRVQQSTDVDDAGELLDRLAEMVDEALEAAPGEVCGVGFGVAGILDSKTGMIAASPHLPLTGVPFEALMGERLGVPVAVDNDGNTSMLAEWLHGAAKGASDAVMLTVGTGIGGGIVANGGLVRGSSGGGAEFGHMVVEQDGEQCSCGGRGHFEWYASGDAIGRAGQRAVDASPDSALAAAAAEGREVTGALVTELAHDGDATSIAAIVEVGRRLGQGMVSVANIFNPQLIVVGGGAIAAGELLLAPAREVVAREALASLGANVAIVPAEFGADAGVIGGAVLAFEQFARA
ncbi:MAG: ROK family protein [Solirubrobacteraceae bacterium]|nr:ROK family protein [Solirubrobacteraceae bacterium]MDP4673187.1 ROK family protein [Solirubrobacteraceae bacterium]MDP4921522.1 ROK family protein [Solirubrobacteraceae bacterium]